MARNLLKDQRFSGFFWTQFLGAFTDNVFKNAFVVMLVMISQSEDGGGIWVSLAQGLFILPFFLFSPLAGQVCDKFSKTQVIRWVKLIEIAIMTLALFGFVAGSPSFLLFVLFLMGTQSTFFGPAKFSLLPQALKRSEVMEATGLVEMGTFLAILLGTILGGILAPSLGDQVGAWILGVVLITLSLVGFIFSFKIPKLPGAQPELKIAWNPVGEFKTLYQLTRSSRSIFYSILGISWFWFFGAAVLSLFPNIVKFTIGGNESLITLFLAMFSISIGVGSVLCEKLSHSDIEIGLIPLGGLGLSFFTWHFSQIDYSVFQGENGLGIFGFLSYGSAWITLFDLFMIGFFGSFFIVPLYALIQTRSDEKTCSQVIAANNIANAIFMVASALMVMAFYAASLDSSDILFVLAILSFIVSFGIMLVLPEFFLRFTIWLLAKTIYRLEYTGREQIPQKGAAIVIANHVSFIDWFILSAACQRPIRFVMHYSFYNIPLANIIFRASGMIPIAQQKENAEIKRQALLTMEQAIRLGDLICIFPEGAISKDGKLAPFREGLKKVAESEPAPIVPVAISGLWGSYFSRERGKALKGLPRPSRRRIKVIISEPIASESASMDDLREVIGDLLEQFPARSRR